MSLLAGIGVESGRAMVHRSTMIDLLKIKISFAVVAVLSSCASNVCSISGDWIEANSMEPMRSTGSYKPILYAQEIEQGRWRWMMYENQYSQSQYTSGDDRELVNAVTAVTKLEPQPLLLFGFAGDHTCNELSEARQRIAEAGKCSKDGIPCIEGTLAELLAAN